MTVNQQVRAEDAILSEANAGVRQLFIADSCRGGADPVQQVMHRTTTVTQSVRGINEGNVEILHQVLVVDEFISPPTPPPSAQPDACAEGYPTITPIADANTQEYPIFAHIAETNDHSQIKQRYHDGANSTKGPRGVVIGENKHTISMSSTGAIPLCSQSLCTNPNGNNAMQESRIPFVNLCKGATKSGYECSHSKSRKVLHKGERGDLDNSCEHDQQNVPPKEKDTSSPLGNGDKKERNIFDILPNVFTLDNAETDDDEPASREGEFGADNSCENLKITNVFSLAQDGDNIDMFDADDVDDVVLKLDSVSGDDEQGSVALSAGLTGLVPSETRDRVGASPIVQSTSPVTDKDKVAGGNLFQGRQKGKRKKKSSKVDGKVDDMDYNVLPAGRKSAQVRDESKGEIKSSNQNESSSKSSSNTKAAQVKAPLLEYYVRRKCTQGQINYAPTRRKPREQNLEKRVLSGKKRGRKPKNKGERSSAKKSIGDEKGSHRNKEEARPLVDDSNDSSADDVSEVKSAVSADGKTSETNIAFDNDFTADDSDDNNPDDIMTHDNAVIGLDDGDGNDPNPASHGCSVFGDYMDDTYQNIDVNYDEYDDFMNENLTTRNDDFTDEDGTTGNDDFIDENVTTGNDEFTDENVTTEENPCSIPPKIRNCSVSLTSLTKDEIDKWRSKRPGNDIHDDSSSKVGEIEGTNIVDTVDMDRDDLDDGVDNWGEKTVDNEDDKSIEDGQVTGYRWKPKRQRIDHQLANFVKKTYKEVDYHNASDDDENVEGSSKNLERSVPFKKRKTSRKLLVAQYDQVDETKTNTVKSWRPEKTPPSVSSAHKLGAYDTDPNIPVVYVDINQGDDEATAATKLRTYTGKALTRSERKSHKYSCTKCGMSYSRKHFLDNHLRLRLCERRFKCGHAQCDKSFRKSVLLRAHQKHHDPQRKFGCEKCGVRFYGKHALLLHMRRHRNARAYACDLCGKGFRTKPMMHVHMWAEHGGLTGTDAEIPSNKKKPEADNTGNEGNHAAISSKKSPQQKSKLPKTFAKENSSIRNENPSSSSASEDENEDLKAECVLCNKYYKNLESLKSHYRYQHKTTYKSVRQIQGIK